MSTIDRAKLRQLHERESQRFIEGTNKFIDEVHPDRPVDAIAAQGGTPLVVAEAPVPTGVAGARPPACQATARTRRCVPTATPCRSR